MKSLLSLLLLCTLLATGPKVAAQEHVYEDSSILYPPETETIEEITTAPAEDETEKVEQTTSGSRVQDTFLVNNRLFLSPDSIGFLRSDKQFGYAKNLDSLLMELKRKEEEQRAKQEAREKKNDRSSDYDPGYDKSPSWVERLFSSNITQYVLWGLAGLFVLFIVYKLFSGAGGFRRTVGESNVKISKEEEDTTPVQERQFDAAIKKAVSESNYRLAVRYLYLQLLQRLAAAGAIEFAVDKTNTEYLREISNKPYKEQVRSLTRYYDYVWYGEFAIDADHYRKIENEFRNLAI